MKNIVEAGFCLFGLTIINKLVFNNSIFNLFESILKHKLDLEVDWH